MPDQPRRGERRRGRPEGRQQQRRGPITVAKGGRMPRWVRDEIMRSTPKDRRPQAIASLEEGAAAFADERFRQAAAALRKAKDLAPRAATVRELLGLSAYQVEDWETALRELRTFRRLTGETAHMAVEMDCLRALGRSEGVEKAWQSFLDLGGTRQAEDEARVVYASHLLDRGQVSEAWRVIKPGRLTSDAPPSALRRWAVAARVAAAGGDRETARTLVAAIRDREPDLPWLEELEGTIG